MEVLSRNLRSVGVEHFKKDILSSTLAYNLESITDNVEDPSLLVNQYEHMLSSFCLMHMPLWELGQLCSGQMLRGIMMMS